jgi:hypothetical protein
VATNVAAAVATIRCDVLMDKVILPVDARSTLEPSSHEFIEGEQARPSLRRVLSVGSSAGFGTSARAASLTGPLGRRGWLITIGVSGAILALRLTLGLGVFALVVHSLTHWSKSRRRWCTPGGATVLPGDSRVGQGAASMQSAQD